MLVFASIAPEGSRSTAYIPPSIRGRVRSDDGAANDRTEGGHPPLPFAPVRLARVMLAGPQIKANTCRSAQRPQRVRRFNRQVHEEPVAGKGWYRAGEVRFLAPPLGKKKLSTDKILRGALFTVDRSTATVRIHCTSRMG